MSCFRAKMHQVWLRLELCPRLPLGELTALPRLPTGGVMRGGGPQAYCTVNRSWRLIQRAFMRCVWASACACHLAIHANYEPCQNIHWRWLQHTTQYWFAEDRLQNANWYSHTVISLNNTRLTAIESWHESVLSVEWKSEGWWNTNNNKYKC